MSSFNYSKWDAIGDSDDDTDDDREQAIRDEIKKKQAVAVPAAPALNPRSEVLLEEGNRVVNALLERNAGRELSAEQREAYGKAATIYDSALRAMTKDEPVLASRLHLNVATCLYQTSSFAKAFAAANRAKKLKSDGADKAEEIANACERELRNAAVAGGVDHHAQGERALDAKDFAKAAKHYKALSLAYAESGGEDEIHALAHLGLAYEQQSRFALAGEAYAKAARTCGDDVAAGGAGTPQRSQLRDRSAACFARAGDDDKFEAQANEEVDVALRGGDARTAATAAIAAAKRFRERKQTARAAPSLTRAVDAMRAAVKKKAQDTIKDRYLLAATADALAEARSGSGDFEGGLVAAKIALDEYDKVSKRQNDKLEAGDEDGTEGGDARKALAKVRRAAAGCALSSAYIAVKMKRDDRAVNLFRDASNRFADLRDFLRAGECALAAARRNAPAGDDDEGVDADQPGAEKNAEDYAQAAKVLALAVDNTKGDVDVSKARTLLARALVGAGRAGDAVEHAKKSVAYLESCARSPGDAKLRADTHELLADALAGAGRPREAARCLETAAGLAAAADDDAWPRRKADGAQLVFNAGAAKSKAGDHGGAAAHFETAISMYEDLGEATAADACRGYLDHERKLEAKGLGGIDE